MIDTDISDVVQRLEEARTAARKVQQDPDLTPKAARERANAIMSMARASAASTISSRMLVADSEALQAENALTDAQSAHEASLDFQRLGVALAEVGALATTVRDAAAGAALIENVLASGDYFKVRAMASAGLASLRGPMLAGGMDAPGAMQYVGLERRVAEKLAELEPESVKLKRQAADAAANARNLLRNRAVALGQNYAPEPGYLPSWRELNELTNPTRTVVTKTERGWIVEKVGGTLLG